MFRIWSIFKSIVLWSYDRGTWQYDILVVIILAFVFLTPNGWFESGGLKHCDTGFYVDAAELARTTAPRPTVDEMIVDYWLQTHHKTIQIADIDPKIDSRRHIIGYCIMPAETGNSGH